MLHTSNFLKEQTKNKKKHVILTSPSEKVQVPSQPKLTAAAIVAEGRVHVDDQGVQIFLREVHLVRWFPCSGGLAGLGLGTAALKQGRWHRASDQAFGEHSGGHFQTCMAQTLKFLLQDNDTIIFKTC